MNKTSRLNTLMVYYNTFTRCVGDVHCIHGEKFNSTSTCRYCTDADFRAVEKYWKHLLSSSRWNKRSRKQLNQDKEKRNFSVSPSGTGLVFCLHLLFSSLADKWALAIQFCPGSLLFQMCSTRIMETAHICVVCLCGWDISSIYLVFPEILFQSPQSKKINHTSKHFNLILLHFHGPFGLACYFFGKLCLLVGTAESFKSTT